MLVWICTILTFTIHNLQQRTQSCSKMIFALCGLSRLQDVVESLQSLLERVGLTPLFFRIHFFRFCFPFVSGFDLLLLFRLRHVISGR